jgi:glycosyltransferase involved in cell wall biosynthesis
MIGGAEEMTLNLVRHLPSQRFEPMVCCIHAAGPIGDEIRQTGTPLAVLGLTPGIRRPLDVVSIARHLRAVRPHIVHTFLLTASLYGRLAAILARVPLVVGSEVNIYRDKRRAHVLAERLLMSGTDCVVASAHAVREFYVRQVHADPSKVEVIYNAVDFEQARPTLGRDAMRGSLGIDRDAIVVGIIARLTEQKGHRILFEALANQPLLQHVQVLVVGGGELNEELQRRAQSLRIDRRVHFLGPRRDLGNLLAAMDVFVLPSLWEGLPLSLVLAMAAERLVVATSVAGVPEVVQDGRTGLLIPPGDVDALGRALARAVCGPDLRARLGAAARASVLPRFGVTQHVNAIADLYDRLWARRSALAA